MVILLGIVIAIISLSKIIRGTANMYDYLFLVGEIPIWVYEIQKYRKKRKEEKTGDGSGTEDGSVC